MEEILHIIITVFLSILSAFLGIFGFTRGLKKDAAYTESRVKELEVRVQTLQGNSNPIEVAKMEQYVKELGKRVDKLDTDVEKKIDQLSEKVDKLTDKMNEMLIHLMKK